MSANRIIVLNELVQRLQDSAKAKKSLENELNLIIEAISEYKIVGICNPRPFEELAIILWNLAIKETRRNRDPSELGMIRILSCKLIDLTIQAVASFDMDLLITGLKFLSQTIHVLIEYSIHEIHILNLLELSEKYKELLLNTIQEPYPKTLRVALISHFSSKANWYWKQGDHDLSLKLFVSAKDLLFKIPKEAFNVSMSLYNSALRLYTQKQYTEAIHWIRQSIEIYDIGENLDSKKQARSLRLLSNCFLQLEDYNEAKKAVDLANERHNTIVGSFLDLKICLKLNQSNMDIISIMQNIIQNPSVSTKECINACEILIKNNQFVVASNIISLIEEKIVDGKYEDVWYCKMRIFIENKQYSEAITFIKQIIRAKNSNQTPIQQLDRFHSELFCLSVKFFDNNDSENAIEWFSLSLEFLELENNIDIAKVNRWKARCYLNIFNVEKANECLQQADKYDPNSICTIYIRFLIALEQENMEELYNIIHYSLDKNIVDYQMYLEVMADAAYKRGKIDITIQVICLLLQCNQLLQDSGKYGEVLLNWIRLCYSQFQKEPNTEIIDKVINQLEESLNKLEFHGSEIIFGDFERKNLTLEYLSHVPWNISLHTRSIKSWNHTVSLLNISTQFAKYRIESKDTIDFRISALILLSSSIIENIKGKEIDNIIINKFSSITKQIKEGILKASNIGINTKKWKGIPEYLDFTIAILQKSPNLSLQLKNLAKTAIEPTILESLISLPIITPINQIPISYSKIWRAYRLLLQVYELPEKDIFLQVSNLMSNIEILTLSPFDVEWFAANAWNNGVSQSRRGNFSEAESWMSIGIKLGKLHPECEEFVSKMIRGYKELLSEN